MPRRKSTYHQSMKIPVKVRGGKRTIPMKVQKEEVKPFFFKPFLKKAGTLVLALAIVSSQVYLLSAFEAHVINVTAHICKPSQTRTIGFWKTHQEIYQNCLSQYLGDEEINSTTTANEIFENANAQDMADQLKAQLLAMKFNIGCFGIDPSEGEEFEGYTLGEIVAMADDILRDPNATREEQEEIKDLLNYINNLHQIKYCSNLGENHFAQNTSYLPEVILHNILSNQSPEDRKHEPETYITSYPLNPTTEPNAQFTFISSTPSAFFQCKINNLDWTNCTSPQPYGGLTPGDYQFSVFATDPKGNYDRSPATYSWTIEEIAEVEAVFNTLIEESLLEEEFISEELPIEEPPIEETTSTEQSLPEEPQTGEQLTEPTTEPTLEEPAPEPEPEPILDSTTTPEIISTTTSENI